MSSNPSTQPTLDKPESLELVLESGQTLLFQKNFDTATFHPPINGATTVEKEGHSDSQEFDNFTLIERISQGGSGIVFKAKDRLDRLWAIKVLREDRLSEEMCRMFLAEAKKMQSLKHRRLLEIQDYRIYEGRPFLILPLCRESFFDKIKEGLLSVREATHLMMQVSEGLAYLHRKGFVHRDIKPGNLLINEKGAACVADLGLLFEASVTPHIPHESPEGLPIPNFVPGTASYMKPEVRAGREFNANPTWDLHAFGVTFYQMLWGDAPPVCSDPASFVDKSREEAVPPLHQQNRRIPAALDRIIARCCAKEGGYTDASQAHAALKRWHYRWLRRLASSFVVVGMLALLLIAMTFQSAEAGETIGQMVAQGLDTGSGETKLPSIREVLDRDGKVNLIGEKGFPTCAIKLGLNKRAVPYLNEKTGVYSIDSTDEVFIELIDKLGDSGYRIEGEILIEGKGNLRSEFTYGLQSVEIGPQRIAHLFQAFAYTRPFAGEGTIEGHTALLVQNVGVDYRYFDKPFTKVRHKLPKAEGSHWGKFAFSVAPNFATLQMDDSPVFEMPSPFVPDAVEFVCEDTKPNPFPDGKADVRTGSVGIMLYTGTIQLKNVTIQKDK